MPGLNSALIVDTLGATISIGPGGTLSPPFRTITSSDGTIVAGDNTGFVKVNTGGTARTITFLPSVALAGKSASVTIIKDEADLTPAAVNINDDAGLFAMITQAGDSFMIVAAGGKLTSLIKPRNS